MPKKKASGWDRPGLPSGGSGIGGLQTAGKMPPDEIGEHQAPGSPGRSPPPAPRLGPSARSPHPSGAPHKHGVRCCALWKCPWSIQSPWLPTRTGISCCSPVSIGDGGARLREMSLKGCHSAIA